MGSFSAVSFNQFTRTMDGIACHAGGWPGASAAAPVPSPAVEALALSYALIHASVGSGMGSKTSGLVPSAGGARQSRHPGGADVVCDSSAAYRATISGFTAADEDEDDEDDEDDDDEDDEEEEEEEDEDGGRGSCAESRASARSMDCASVLSASRMRRAFSRSVASREASCASSACSSRAAFWCTSSSA